MVTAPVEGACAKAFAEAAVAANRRTRLRLRKLGFMDIFITILPG